MKRTVIDTNIISSALGGALVLILERWDKGETSAQSAMHVGNQNVRVYIQNTLACHSE